MKPLHVAVCTKATSRGRFDRVKRTWGLWTSPVPEFTWEYVAVEKRQTLDTGQLKNAGFDLVFLEDGAWANFLFDVIPVAYYIVDSTVTDAHYSERYNQAEGVNLILLDHDKAERFITGAPVRQLPHCVNTQIFKDYGPKTVDIAIHMATRGPCKDERKTLKQMLPSWCKREGFSYSTGPLGVEHYAAAMGVAKIVVNWPRNPSNRSHRVLDAMACNSTLITGPIPDVPADYRRDGTNYIEVESIVDMLQAIRDQLEGGRGAEVAYQGFRLVQKHHSWKVRAIQLRAILKEELDL